MAKLVHWVIVIILMAFGRITLSDDSYSKYYSWNYGGVSSNEADAASSRGYESPPWEENQYDTTPSAEGGDVEPYNETRYADPSNAGSDNSFAADDAAYASAPDMSSAPSSLETVPNNSDETYKDEPSPSPSPSPLSSPSYDGSSTPQSDSSYGDSYSSSDDWSSSSSPTRDEDSSPSTTDESQSVSEEKYNSVEEAGSGVDGTDTKTTEHSGSKAGLVFGLLIGVCAVGAAGFIYVKKTRESYPNTDRYISLTRLDRI